MTAWIPTDWNWTAIEALASLAGVIGVVVSIVFLIYEVRHNARAIEGATVQSLMSLEREVFTLMADNAALFARGGKDHAALTPEEQFRYHRIVASLMSLNFSAFLQFERDLIDREIWEAYGNAVRRYARAPGFAVAWAEVRDGYPASFRKAMAGVVPAPPGDTAS